MHRWPKYWSFSFSNSPSKEYSGLTGLISFCLRNSQGSSPASQFESNSSALSLRYGSTLISIYDYREKTITLTMQTFVRKAASLLFNRLSRLVIAFLPRSKHLLISWLKSISAVILESKKIKSSTVYTFPIHCREAMGSGGMILIFLLLTFKAALSLSSYLFYISA